MKNKKIITIIILIGCLTGLFTYSIWTNKYKINHYVCESSLAYNNGIGIDFDVKGNKIMTIIKKDTVTRKFIKENLSDTDIDAAFQEYKQKAEKKFREIGDKYKDNKQFAVTYHASDDKIVTKYYVYVGNDNFNVKKSSGLLQELGLMGFYNQKQHAFLYQESAFLKQSPLNMLPDVSCKTK